MRTDIPSHRAGASMSANVGGATRVLLLLGVGIGGVLLGGAAAFGLGAFAPRPAAHPPGPSADERAEQQKPEPQKGEPQKPEPRDDRAAEKETKLADLCKQGDAAIAKRDYDLALAC